MGVSSDNHLILSTYDIIRWDGKVWMVSPISDDSTARERLHAASYVNLTEVNSDGTLGHQKTFDRRKVKAECQYIHNAKTILRVALPEDVQLQIQEYEKEDANLDDDDREVDDDHPSYGAITLHKYSGHAKLFMSPFRHQHYIGISIHKASKRRSLSEDHMFGSVRTICEVLMSEAQFARFITNPMDGNGTPCTLHHITGTYFPEPPYEEEKEKFHKDVEHSAKKAAEFVTRAENKLRLLFEKKTMSKADKEEIMGLVHDVGRQLSDSMPFTLSQMQERMDKIVAQAGTEIDSYLSRIVTHTGLKVLTGVAPPVEFLDTSKKPALSQAKRHGPGIRECNCDYSKSATDTACVCCGAASGTPCPNTTP
jgi:hypothetical protein